MHLDADDGKIDDAYLLRNEWPTYVFDALLMVGVLGICLKWHIGRMAENSEAIQMGESS